jgi:hypothetical protein
MAPSAQIFFPIIPAVAPYDLWTGFHEKGPFIVIIALSFHFGKTEGAAGNHLFPRDEDGPSEKVLERNP